MTDILADLLGSAGSEREVVRRYTRRLMALARRHLPEPVRRRLDPEDIVQSVYRSFFRRLQQGRFALADPDQLWRLLAAMTFHKARNASKFHQRRRRDARRDLALSGPGDDVPAPGPDDVDLLFESLQELLAGLPEGYRVIVSRRLEGQSIEAIATAVHRSQRTVLRVLAHVHELAARRAEGVS